MIDYNGVSLKEIENLLDTVLQYQDDKVWVIEYLSNALLLERLKGRNKLLEELLEK